MFDNNSQGLIFKIYVGSEHAGVKSIIHNITLLYTMYNDNAEE